MSKGKLWKGKSYSLFVRMPEDMGKKIVALAQEKALDTSAYVRMTLKEHLDKQKKEEKNV
jgi:hypothetical protein